MSEVKVNKISPRSGTTVTLGDSGDTFTIPSGATINNQGTATNFGATGSASWVTTVKTGDFTAVAGEGYFVDTSSAPITVTLPASPDAGAVVAVSDYANTFDTNNLTLARNGSNIEGAASNFVINVEGTAITLVYVDSTKGWIVTDTGNSTDAFEIKYVAASGGTETTCGNFKIHTFTGPGTFTVSCGGNAEGSTTVDYLVIAGGGSGGTRYGGGGGAGGYRFSNGTASGCYSAGPAPLGASALPVTAQGFPITVGGGGAGVSESPSPTCKTGNRGDNSVFSTITSTGGGGGVKQNQTGPQEPASPGGSGGGSSYNCGPGGTGNTPPVSPPQGNTGGNGLGNPYYTTGGGGGAGGVGGNGPQSQGGVGGAGLASSITGSAVTRGGGGGGAGSQNNSTSPGPAHPGGGGGSPGGGSPGSTTTAGTVNTGGGSGGGYGYPGNSGNGGSGIVVIRYKFQ
jgi:hypothetical protein